MGSGVEHYQSLKGFVCTFGLKGPDAEDTIQEAYLGHATGRARGTVRFDRAYLVRCVERGARKTKGRRRHEISLDRIPEPADRGYRVPDDDGTERIEKVRACIGQLPPVQAFIMDALLEGRKRADIMAVLNISRATYHRQRIAAFMAIRRAFASD